MFDHVARRVPLSGRHQDRSCRFDRHKFRPFVIMSTIVRAVVWRFIWPGASYAEARKYSPFAVVGSAYERTWSNEPLNDGRGNCTYDDKGSEIVALGLTWPVLISSGVRYTRHHMSERLVFSLVYVGTGDELGHVNLKLARWWRKFSFLYHHNFSFFHRGNLMGCCRRVWQACMSFRLMLHAELCSLMRPPSVWREWAALRPKSS
jgi:hypothetical protein